MICRIPHKMLAGGNGMQKFRCGETVPMSCNYTAYDSNGISHDEEKTYLEKGTTFPPLQHEGGYWVMDHE